MRMRAWPHSGAPTGFGPFCTQDTFPAFGAELPLPLRKDAVLLQEVDQPDALQGQEVHDRSSPPFPVRPGLHGQGAVAYVRSFDRVSLHTCWALVGARFASLWLRPSRLTLDRMLQDFFRHDATKTKSGYTDSGPRCCQNERAQ